MEAFDCNAYDIDLIEVCRGTTYDNGDCDWTTYYAQRTTGHAVAVYTYAGDPTPVAGAVAERRYRIRRRLMHPLVLRWA